MTLIRSVWPHPASSSFGNSGVPTPTPIQINPTQRLGFKYVELEILEGNIVVIKFKQSVLEYETLLDQDYAGGELIHIENELKDKKNQSIRPLKVILDITRVKCDSRDLQTLVPVNGRLKNKGIQLTIIGVDEQMFDVLLRTGLNKLFHIYRTREDAIKEENRR